MLHKDSEARWIYCASENELCSCNSGHAPWPLVKSAGGHQQKKTYDGQHGASAKQIYQERQIKSIHALEIVDNIKNIRVNMDQRSFVFGSF